MYDTTFDKFLKDNFRGEVDFSSNLSYIRYIVMT